MSFICEFCNNEFKNQSILNNHLKTAKYCLNLRNETGKNICQYCNKILSNKNNLLLHQEKCKYSQKNFEILENQIIQKNIIIENKDKIISEKDKIISEKTQYIDKLQNQIFELARNNSSNRNTISTNNSNNNTTTNNNNITNNTTINLIPLTNEWLISQAENLTEKHLENGAYGYAQFAAQYSFKDRVKCTDLSRNIFLYKNENGQTVKDKGPIIAQQFFNSIKIKNQELFTLINNRLCELLVDASASETNYILDSMAKNKDNAVGVNNIARGEKDILQDDFIKQLSSQLPKVI
jgi:hypothetical protein